MKISDLPEGPVLEALLERLPSHQHDWEYTPTELFDEWLQWHGIIGWTSSILETLDLIKKAAK